MYIEGEYFYGNKVSEYGLKHGFVDYLTLSKAFDNVLHKDILDRTKKYKLGKWEQLSGPDTEDDNTDIESEISQWYIIDRKGAEILQAIREVVLYNEALNLYLWGVSHYEKPWDLELTSIAIRNPDDTSPICPICNERIKGEPAISRVDNQTLICSNCAEAEAMDEMNNT